MAPLRYRPSRLEARLGAAADRAPLLAKPICCPKFEQESIASSFHLLSRRQSKSSVSLADALGILTLSEHNYSAPDNLPLTTLPGSLACGPKDLNFSSPTVSRPAAGLPWFFVFCLFVCFPSQTPSQLVSSPGFF